MSTILSKVIEMMQESAAKGCKAYPVYRQAGVTCEEVSVLPFGMSYLEPVIAFSLIVYLFELYLDIRQLSMFKKSAMIPSELKDHVNEETFRKSIAYRRDKFHFKIVEGVFGLLFGMSCLLLGYLPFLWDLAATSATSLGLLAPSSGKIYSEFIVTYLFLCLQMIVDLVWSLPWSLYSTFIIEGRHGFNKSTLLLFLQDKTVSFLLTLVISLVILPLVIGLAVLGGDRFVLYVWLCLVAVSFVLMTIYPSFIAPLFNKFSPLEEGTVRTAINELAKSVFFPLSEVFVVDGSRRSAHSNAYFYDFFKKKRIVLYDTLLKQVDVDELLAILGHEIGHWALGHSLQNYLVTQTYTLALLSCYSLCSTNALLLTSFGFSSPCPALFVGLMLFTASLWTPVDKLPSLLLTMNSRRNEFAADAYAVALGRGKELGQGLIKISVENLDNFLPDAWYSAYHYSHPPLLERLRALPGGRSQMQGKGDKKKM